MANGFGYPRLPQRPSPDSRMVGMALAQQGPMGAGVGPAMGPEMGMEMMPPMMAEGDPAESMGSNAMRRQGARHMGGPGQSAEGNPALAHAIGEALTRMGGGYQTNPHRVGKQTDRAKMDLMRNGLSETEADLLLMSGGF